MDSTLENVPPIAEKIKHSGLCHGIFFFPFPAQRVHCGAVHQSDNPKVAAESNHLLPTLFFAQKRRIRFTVQTFFKDNDCFVSYISVVFPFKLEGYKVQGCVVVVWPAVTVYSTCLDLVFILCMFGFGGNMHGLTFQQHGFKTKCSSSQSVLFCEICQICFKSIHSISNYWSTLALRGLKTLHNYSNL